VLSQIFINKHFASFLSRCVRGFSRDGINSAKHGVITKTILNKTLLAAFSLGLATLSASAISFNYTFVDSGAGLDGPEDATASFSISGNVVTIVLNNLEANPTGAGQLISGITFNALGATGASGMTSSGVLATIGVGVLNSGNPVTLPHWGFSFSGGALTLVETAGSAAMGGSPVDMIIGPDASGNPNSFNPTDYTAANSSITGNHQPSVLGTATFMITFTGDVTNFSDVEMAFGTGPDNFVPGTPNTPGVPDGGSTAILLGSAMIGLGSLRTWLRRK
jgi:hypothetical protein